MFLRALGREPSPTELARWGDALRDFGADRCATVSDLLADRGAWVQIAHALFNTKEFIYYR
jgi:hypothetical protein